MLSLVLPGVQPPTVGFPSQYPAWPIEHAVRGASAAVSRPTSGTASNAVSGPTSSPTSPATSGPASNPSLSVRPIMFPSQPSPAASTVPASPPCPSAASTAAAPSQPTKNNRSRIDATPMVIPPDPSLSQR